MSEIRKGDWVVVIKPAPCCGHADSIGLIFKVCDDSFSETGFTRCSVCGDRYPTHSRGHEVLDSGGYSWSVLRLKRIDPLPESERTNTTDEVTA